MLEKDEDEDEDEEPPALPQITCCNRVSFEPESIKEKILPKAFVDKPLPTPRTARPAPAAPSPPEGEADAAETAETWRNPPEELEPGVLQKMLDFIGELLGDDKQDICPVCNVVHSDKSHCAPKQVPLKGWKECRKICLKLGLTLSPRFQRGSRCNYFTRHWDDSYWLANHAEGTINGGTQTEKLVHWDCDTKVVWDMDNDVQLCCIENYHIVEETCLAIAGASGVNLFLSGHWTTVDLQGTFEGEQVYWDHRDQTLDVCRVEDLVKRKREYAAFVKERDYQTAQWGDDEAEDMQMSALGIPLVLDYKRRKLADLLMVLLRRRRMLPDILISFFLAGCLRHGLQWCVRS